MSKWIRRIAISAVGLVGLIVVLTWLLLSSSLLATQRGNLVARLITDKSDLGIEINGGVRVGLGQVIHISVQDLAFPSPTLSEVNLAEIGEVEFGVSLAELLSGQVELQNLRADAVNINLLVDQQGARSWSGTEAKPKAAGAAPVAAAPSNQELLGFLGDRRIQVSNSHLLYQDARNGLDLGLALTSVDLSQDDENAPILLVASGALNGQELSLEGHFPKRAPFNIAVDFSQMALSVEGTPSENGYVTTASLDIVELGQLLDALKLEKSVSGSGKIRAVLDTSAAPARVPELEVQVALDGGQSLSVKGDLGELGNPSDVSIDTSIRLYPADKTPPPTTSRRELKLVGVDMGLAAQPNGVPLRSMVIETNGFTLDTGGEGKPPITVSGLSRSPDGKLRLGQAELRIGPPSAPFLILAGSVSDALRLEGIDFEGELAIPAAGLLTPEQAHVAKDLGMIAGGFELKGNAKVLGLSNLNAVSQGTELWHLEVTGSLRNALNFSDIALNIDVDVPSGGELLQAMGLSPVEISDVALTADISSQETDWKMAASVEVAESELGLNLDLNLDDPNPTVRGQIDSDQIRIAELRKIIAASVQLGTLSNQEGDGAGAADSAEAEPEIQPLVLGTKIPEASDAAETGSPVRDLTLQPLGQAILLSGADLDVSIDLRKIEGEKGTIHLKSGLTMKDQVARLGPLKLEYDGAHIDVSGSIDLAKAPDVLALSGSAGGWNLGKILHELDVKKQASGVLNADFDISGRFASGRDFLKTLTGAATLSMGRGSIDTQLLDVAGLGIIPWLFTDHKGQAAPIMCALVPLQLHSGRVSSKRIVVETDDVQVVVYGDVDLGNMTLDISGQPRKIGKPLSRSPWPFTLTGSIAKPKVKVKDGPRRLARSDGASTMPQNRRACVPDILQLR